MVCKVVLKRGLWSHLEAKTRLTFERGVIVETGGSTRC